MSGIDPNKFIDMSKIEKVPFLLLFWGQGCGPCDKIKPVFAELSDKYRGSYQFVAMKAAEQYKLAGYFKLQAIPSLVLVNNDGTFNKMTGPRTKEDIEGFINDTSR